MRSDSWWSPAALAERVTGLPARFSLPIVVAAQGAMVGVVGLYWDAGRHAEHASADYLTWPHLLMLYGFEAVTVGAVLLHAALDGPTAPDERPMHGARIWITRVLLTVELLLSRVLTMVLAPGRPRRTGTRRTTSRGARVMLVSATIALTAFPFAELLDRLLGLDPSVADPVHLLVIACAIASTIGVIVMLGDAFALAPPLWPARTFPAIAAGALLVGMSAFAATLDVGAAAEQPALQALMWIAATAVALGFARAWIGPGGALAAAAVFVGVRIAVLVAVGPVLDGQTAHLSLPLVEAMAVELWFARSRWVAGAVLGVAGLTAEWAWAHVALASPWPAGVLALAPVAALLGAAGVVAGSTLEGRLLLSDQYEATGESQRPTAITRPGAGRR